MKNMKKLLGTMATLGFTTVAAVNVVACNNNNTPNTPSNDLTNSFETSYNIPFSSMADTGVVANGQKFDFTFGTTENDGLKNTLIKSFIVTRSDATVQQGIGKQLTATGDPQGVVPTAVDQLSAGVWADNQIGLTPDEEGAVSVSLTLNLFKSIAGSASGIFDWQQQSTSMTVTLRVWTVLPTSQEIVSGINAVSNYVTSTKAVSSGGYINLKANITSDFIKDQLEEPIKSAFDITKLNSIKIMNGGTELTDTYFTNVHAATDMTMTYTYDSIAGSTKINVEVTAPTSQDVVDAINAVATYVTSTKAVSSGGYANLKANITGDFIKAQLTDPFITAFNFSKFGNIKIMNGGTELTDTYFTNVTAATDMTMTYTYDSIAGSTALNVEVTAPTSQDVVDAINAVTTYAVVFPSGDDYAMLKAQIDDAFIKAQLTDPFITAFDFSKFGNIKILNNGIELTDTYFDQSRPATDMIMTYTYDGIAGSTKFNLWVR